MNKRITKKSEFKHLNRAKRDEIWQALVDDYNNVLKVDGVKIPKRNSSKASWLILLKAFETAQVQKEVFGEFAKIENPNASGDQQVRHLKRDGWYVLGAGDKIPHTQQTIPAGDYLMVTSRQKHPDYSNQTAGNTLTQAEFEKTKNAFGNRCASCGSVEGQPHRYHSTKIVTLHKGHMDPNKPLTKENVIPQCQVCNQSYKDKFIFDKTGKVRKINSVDLVIAADIQLQEKIFKRLKPKFEPESED